MRRCRASTRPTRSSWASRWRARAGIGSPRSPGHCGRPGSGSASWPRPTTSGSTSSQASASRSSRSRSSTASGSRRRFALTSSVASVKERYTVGARALATRSMGGLARSRVTPNALTASGVLLCAVASVLVYFEYRGEILFYWVGAVVFVIGSVLDILDGPLARRSGKGTPFGAFLDSTTARVSEGFMLGSIALVFHRHGNEV